MTKSEYEAKYGVAPNVSATPVKMTRVEYETKYGIPVETPKEPTFLGGIVRGMLKTPARIATNVVQAGQTALGKEKTQPFSGDYLGEVKPIGQEGTFGEKLKESVGAGLEMASYIPITKGVGLGYQGLQSAIKSKTIMPTLKAVIKPLAAEGAVGGGLTMAGSALQEQKSIPRSLLEGAGGAVAGSILAPALGTALPILTGTLKGISKKVASYLDPEKAAIELESKVLNKFKKGVKPRINASMTPTGAEKYDQNILDGVITIKENKPNLSFNDEAGEVIIGENPKSLQQFSDALEQTKKNIFEQYNTVAQQAGDAGVQVQTKNIVNELNSVINNKALSLTNPEAIKYARLTQARYGNIGAIDAATAQDVIQNYNKSLEAFYRNPSYDNASRAAIDAMVANNMRKALDDGITGLTGTQYSILKKQYGSLKAIEKDVIKATLRDARKNTKGLIDFTDIFSGGQVVNGILSLNPATIAQGVTAKAIAEFYKYLNNPNRAIQQMFDLADKLPQRLNQSSKSGNSLLQIKPKPNIPITPNKNVIPATIPQKSLKGKGVIPKTNLATEAKKYKSAGKGEEEFMLRETRGLFHATDDYAAQSINKKGFTLGNESTSKLGAKDKMLGDGIYFGKSRSAVSQYGDSVVEARISKNLNIKDISNEELLKAYQDNGWQITKTNPAEISNYFKKLGYDGLRTPRETVIFDPKNVLTKSQLTDIWNKANKSSVLPKPKEVPTPIVSSKKHLQTVATQKGYNFTKIVDDINVALKKAEGSVDYLKTATDKTVKGMKDVLTVPVGVKKFDRTLEKVVLEAKDGDILDIKDLTRNSIIPVTKTSYQKVLEQMRKRSDIVREKPQPPSKFMGYEGTIFNIESPNGLIIETQIVSPAMIYGKVETAKAIEWLGKDLYNKVKKLAGIEGERGHLIYEKFRGLSDAEKLEKVGQDLIKQSEEYYGILRKIEL